MQINLFAGFCRGLEKGVSVFEEILIGAIIFPKMAMGVHGLRDGRMPSPILDLFRFGAELNPD